MRLLREYSTELWGGSKRHRGSKHHNAKPKLYYAINTAERSNFKKTCKVQGWDMNEFEEVTSEEFSNSGKKRYYYALKSLYYRG